MTLKKKAPELVFAVAVLAAGTWLYSTLHISEPYVGDRLAPGNVVKMYSLTTCPYCADKRRHLTAAGIPFTEYFMDTDQSRLREFLGLLKSNDVQGGVGTPTLVVNDTLLVNNPSMDAIKAHLKFKSG